MPCTRLADSEASLDWYHIDLKDTIGVLTPQDVIDRCFAGETTLCDLVTFNPDQSVASIVGQNLNLGKFDLKGIDSELRYTQHLGAGDLALGVIGELPHSQGHRAFGRRHRSIPPASRAPRPAFGTPDFKATASAGYEIGNWGHYLQMRYIGSGVYAASYGPEDLSEQGQRYRRRGFSGSSDNKV